MFNPAAAKYLGIVQRLGVHWKRSVAHGMCHRVLSLLARMATLAGWMIHHVVVRLGTVIDFRNDYRRRRALAHRLYEGLVRKFSPVPVQQRTLLVMTKNAWDKFAYPDEMRGWKNFLRGEVTLRYVEGNHLNIFNDPNLETLVTATREFLDSQQRSELPEGNRILATTASSQAP